MLSVSCDIQVQNWMLLTFLVSIITIIPNYFEFSYQISRYNRRILIQALRGESGVRGYLCGAGADVTRAGDARYRRRGDGEILGPTLRVSTNVSGHVFVDKGKKRGVNTK